MTADTPRIALISATPAAIGPAVDGLTTEFPEAEIWNLLDDKLLADANSQGGVTDQLGIRMNRLIRHALTEGADAVLLTCSLYAAVAQTTTADVPVLAPDEASFDEALSGSFRRILLIASFESALLDVITRFKAAAEAAGRDATVTGAIATAALRQPKPATIRHCWPRCWMPAHLAPEPPTPSCSPNIRWHRSRPTCPQPWGYLSFPARKALPSSSNPS